MIKNFLGESDKIVKKYFDLKTKAKEEENLRKIGLYQYFEPVTSVIKKEIEPIRDLISLGNNKDNFKESNNVLKKLELKLNETGEDRIIKDDRMTVDTEDTEGDRMTVDTEDDRMTVDTEDDRMTVDTDWDRTESDLSKSKKYKEIKNFVSSEELNKNYPKKKKKKRIL